MDSTLTITVADLVGLLIIAGVILAVFLMVAVYNLIKTLKQTQKMLADFEVVAHIASERTKQLDKFINDAQKKVKSGQNIFNFIPLIISAVGQISKAVGQNQNQKKKD